MNVMKVKSQNDEPAFFWKRNWDHHDFTGVEIQDIPGNITEYQQPNMLVIRVRTVGAADMI